MALDYASQVKNVGISGDAAVLLSVRDSDKSKPYIPLAGGATDGWSKDDEATATCFCGAVQLAFPTVAPGLVDTFVCNCTDCRKLTASMFTSAFIINNEYLKHIRGQSNLKQFSQSSSIATRTLMTNYFCDTCGTLMYRVAERFPGHSLLRLGTVDDFNLVETKLRPRTEAFTKDRVRWFPGVPGEDVRRFETNPA
ncbi:hypothetical protein BU24DRAFT_348105 [Aaosphaeria arxii CBS 175.79]|uniref:CENP-V/GFA domain-containing protein n=1 Tax=Aaosphaeria arxii CBS 175.79 TaxID=1450172 RepID=A0A6A5XS93_9PLEO|nr:uncharacterized protein BU24DRAFT_348105 [Aaosphaeria arxii CBS 175.79]KAF2015134.1 hypothetical protein BU24DRAFT_348105 [Aaosphaeria arxii CBS 175.79]